MKPLENLGKIISDNPNCKVKQLSVNRIPLVDQCIELANLMDEFNTKKERAEVLSVAAECLKLYQTPIFIIKKDNNE